MNRNKGATWLAGLALLGSLAFAGCGRKDVNRRGEIKLRGEKPVSLERKRDGDLLQEGAASWYGEPFHGRRTSNGEIYDMWTLTAAHKTLPFGTVVKVVNKENNRSVLVRVNDRGPFVRGRIIDLSRKAARELGIEAQGVGQVALYLASEKTGTASRSRSRAEAQPPPGGRWTVQVGSFRERARAQAIGDRMRAYSDRVRIAPAGDFFRVRVGRFGEKRDAVRLAALLFDEEGLDCWVVLAD